MATEPKIEPDITYGQLHRPRKEFKSRSDYLDNELLITNPGNKRWGTYKYGRDFRFEWEDLVPAIAGTIGTAVLAFGVVGAYAAQYGLPAAFVLENVRLEMVLVGLIMVIVNFFHPRLAGTGIHGWMIPLIPMIVAAGGHPLALGLMIGGVGMLLGFIRGGALLQALTPNGVIAGLLILFGIEGMIGQVAVLRTWSAGTGIEGLFMAMAGVVMLVYGLLLKWKARYLAIPLCTAAAAIVALAMGAPFVFRTPPGLPNFNPAYWWGADTGWMIGLPGPEAFIAMIPFAIIAVVLWPPDAIGLMAFQRAGYPAGSEKAFLHVDDSFIAIAARQAITVAWGVGMLSDPWGTYVIPASVAKRPLQACGILMGAIVAITPLTGYLLDVCLFPPVVRIGLIIGVFVPLFEIGMRLLKTPRDAFGAAMCIGTGMFINPVIGWSFAMTLENYGGLGPIEPERLEMMKKVMSRKTQLIISTVTLIICLVIMAWVGLLPGIPKF